MRFARPRSLVLPAALLAACAGGTTRATSPSATDPIGRLPAGPLTIVAANEREDDADTIEEVTFRDAGGAVHSLELRITSYPIHPNTLRVDGAPCAIGASWEQLGHRLFEAGLSNNATLLLISFGAEQQTR